MLPVLRQTHHPRVTATSYAHPERHGPGVPAGLSASIAWRRSWSASSHSWSQQRFSSDCRSWRSAVTSCHAPIATSSMCLYVWGRVFELLLWQLCHGGQRCPHLTHNQLADHGSGQCRLCRLGRVGGLPNLPAEELRGSQGLRASPV